MNHNRNGDEPIIAERRSREPARDDVQPLWRFALALVAGVAVTALLAWWVMNAASSDGAAKVAPSQIPEPETRPDAVAEERIEQTPLPQARDLQSETDSAQSPALPASSDESAAGTQPAATPEGAPEDVPGTAVETPALAPAPVSVKLMSPDPQVQIELRGPLDSSPPVTGQAGDVVTVAPGTYRVVASGNGLETFEQAVRFEGGQPLEYTIELCGQRQHERENLAGQVVEERACASTAECESTFMVLSEEADQLVKDHTFRTQQCARWRPNATPEGRWTLDIQCGGATLATTCHVAIGEGACTFVEPSRSARGTACPRVELK